MRGERGAGAVCWGWPCWGLVAQVGHSQPQHGSETLLLSPDCVQCCAAGGTQRMEADAKSVPFMLQHTRAAVSPEARQAAWVQPCQPSSQMAILQTQEKKYEGWGN